MKISYSETAAYSSRFAFRFELSCVLSWFVHSSKTAHTCLPTGGCVKIEAYIFVLGIQFTKVFCVCTIIFSNLLIFISEEHRFMRVCTCCYPPRVTYTTIDAIEVPDNSTIRDAEESSLNVDARVLEEAGLIYFDNRWCMPNLKPVVGLYSIVPRTLV
ncbi:hypothetical protein HY967_04500 [Candidatus Jorgensenbacteria bacterium]|nr:hypothetical protein [Candidatus Jorgensenbacteria bacterium]